MVGTGYPNTIGQIQTRSFTFSATLTNTKKKKLPKDCRVLGDVKFNGDIVLFVDGGTVTKDKGLNFNFNNRTKKTSSIQHKEKHLLLFKLEKATLQTITKTS